MCPSAFTVLRTLYVAFEGSILISIDLEEGTCKKGVGVISKIVAPRDNGALCILVGTNRHVFARCKEEP